MADGNAKQPSDRLKFGNIKSDPTMETLRYLRLGDPECLSYAALRYALACQFGPDLGGHLVEQGDCHALNLSASA